MPKRERIYTKVLSVKLKPDEYKRLEFLAKLEQKSKSDIVRTALLNYIKKREEKHKEFKSNKIKIL